MATVSNWNLFGVTLDLTATAATIKRTSATQFTVVVNASWKCHESGNKTNYGMKVTSGGKTIYIPTYNGEKHSSGSGSLTGTYSISGNGAQTKSISVTFTAYKTDVTTDASKSTTITLSVSVPAWTSYIVKYNANGGTGAPGNQTKWKGQTLTLSSTKPTRTGYSFLGWSTSATATSARYSAGGKYTSDPSTAGATINLYAVWKANEYPVRYDANGGTGAPSSQTKIYGKTLKLSTVKPTRTFYDFLGWATTSTSTIVQYAAGANYTANAAISLYAVWALGYRKPKISEFILDRCDSSGTLDDAGTYAKIKLKWSCDRPFTNIVVDWDSESAGNGSTTLATGNDTSTEGEGEYVVGGELSLDSLYTFTITVSDSQGSATRDTTLSGNIFAIDIYREGKGIAFGKPAELEGVCDIGFQARFFKGIKHPVLVEGADLDKLWIPNIYVGKSVGSSNYTCGGDPIPVTSGTFSLEVIGMGDAGQIKQRITYCHKTDSRAWERIYHSSSWGDWVCVSDFDGHLLWTHSGYYMTAGHTATLNEPVSKQRSGIVLAWCSYQDSAATNIDWYYHFVPKYHVRAYNANGVTTGIMSNANAERLGRKYVHVYDNQIVGHESNNATETKNGVTFTNSFWVLRHVIGV